MGNERVALVYVNYPEPYQQTLVKTMKDSGYSVVSVIPDGKSENVEEAKNALKHAEIAILGSGLPADDLENAPNLRWTHFDWVGIQGVLTDRMFSNGRVISNGSGRNSICLAEHVFYFIFTLSYGTREIFASQDSHQWGVEHPNPYSSLFGKTMLIVGVGSIGREVAIRAKAFGMKTIGYSRSTKAADDLFDVQASKDAADDLVALTREADYVVLAASLNTESYHLIDSAVFEAMKETAFLINICRGSVVDEQALEAALKTGAIAGAGCDTFETEPLPATSGLWSLKNLVITPHSTPQSPLKFDQGLKVITENLKRLDAGESLLNQQSPKDLLQT